MNRLPHSSLGKRSPHEIPNLDHLRTFGCDAWVGVPNPEKGGDRGKLCIFLGYQDGLKAGFYEGDRLVQGIQRISTNNSKPSQFAMNDKFTLRNAHEPAHSEYHGCTDVDDVSSESAPECTDDQESLSDYSGIIHNNVELDVGVCEHAEAVGKLAYDFKPTAGRCRRFD